MAIQRESDRDSRGYASLLLNDKAREVLTFVPIPPSKAKSDPLYDDRMEQILRKIWPGQQIDMRELVIQPVSTSTWS